MVPPCSDRISRVPPYSSLRSFVYDTLVRGCHPLWLQTFQKVPLSLTTLKHWPGPVRSPLLRKSRLMSFPPVTEMFQFAGFASYPKLCIHTIPPKGWVSPLRYLLVKGYHLATAFRTLNGIHRLYTPRHPPNARLENSSIFRNKSLNFESFPWVSPIRMIVAGSKASIIKAPHGQKRLSQRTTSFIACKIA